MVDAVGDCVELAPGQKVATMMGGLGRSIDGSYAEYAVVDAANVIPFDTDLPWAVVGALPEMLQTAHGSITAGLGLKSGHTVLIHGGTSTVGLTAIAIARHLGSPRNRHTLTQPSRPSSSAVASLAVAALELSLNERLRCCAAASRASTRSCRPASRPRTHSTCANSQKGAGPSTSGWL
ncbi:hypothetical protein SB659_18335 [Arthrobacter sp. SIMBA_036]